MLYKKMKTQDAQDFAKKVREIVVVLNDVMPDAEYVLVVGQDWEHHVELCNSKDRPNIIERLEMLTDAHRQRLAEESARNN